MLSANILQVLPAWQALFQEPELPRKPDSQVPVGHRDRGTNTSLTPTRHAERQHLTQPSAIWEASWRRHLAGAIWEASWRRRLAGALCRQPGLCSLLGVGLLRSCSQPLQAGAAQISEDSLGLPVASG